MGALLGGRAGRDELGDMNESASSPEARREEADAMVDEYLEELLRALAGRREHARRTLAEAEEHLRDAVNAGVEQGLAPDEAAAAAIECFGTPGQIARAGGFAVRPWVVAGRAAHLLFGVGLLAIGISGLVAETFYRLWGPLFVAGDAPGVTYTAERCAQYFTLAPDGGSCLEAAAIHHSGEVIEPRVGAGLLGLIILASYWWLARRRRPSQQLDSTTPLVAAAAAASMFGVVGLAMLLQGVAVLAEGPDYGPGGILSAGLVSAVCCVGALVALRRYLGARDRLPI